MEIILLALFYVLTPVLILYLTYRFRTADRLGSVIIAYLVGLILGNIGLIPSPGEVINSILLNQPGVSLSDLQVMEANGEITAEDVMAFRVYKLRDLLMSITVLLAIPLMLFSTNIHQWKKVAGKTMVSMLAGMVAVVSVIIAGYYIFQDSGTEDLWKVSGMLIGVYTGGTPNLASIKMALDVDPEIYILTHTYDLVVGVFYLAFLITIGQRVFHKFLPKFPDFAEVFTAPGQKGKRPFFHVFQRRYFIPLLKAIGVAVLIFGLGYGLSIILPKSMEMTVIILTITTLGIIASLIPGINKIDKTFDAGMYFILVFSLVVSSMADIRNFGGITPGLFGYVTLAVFGSLFLHVLLSKIFKVDADTTMITSTAFICSPAFVPVIAGAINNRQVIVSGMTIGIIGYAVGNYLGVTIAYLLR
ncbi:MAG: DUF819 family protein [Bacteroidales bacterium]|jgi:uncharacterized membrane protein|nr:DUF819 family protein [Bacteroidales bacterium]NLM92374.1 DUF819 family protein [Bacteroidales bacterium]